MFVGIVASIKKYGQYPHTGKLETYDNHIKIWREGMAMIKHSASLRQSPCDGTLRVFFISTKKIKCILCISKYKMKFIFLKNASRTRTLLSNFCDFNTRNKLLTQKLLKQGYRYHKLRKTFSKFYRRYYDLISKFQVGLKSLLRQGLSEPDFYGDLVYKLKKIDGSNNFSAQFIKIISHYKKIGYNINVLQQTACLVVNPITVGNFAFLFNCTPVGRTSDSMMVPT